MTSFNDSDFYYSLKEAGRILDEKEIPTKGRMFWKDGVLYKQKGEGEKVDIENFVIKERS